MQLDELREKALANFELLLEYLKVDFRKVTENEYDILATWRTDRNFGSVRFNTEKNRGADFAGGSLTEADFAALGNGFSKEDFVGFSGEAQAKIGFDVIGVFQRIFRNNNYRDTAQLLNAVLIKISSDSSYVQTARDAKNRRIKLAREKAEKLKKVALDLWESSKHHKIDNSPAQRYLQTRGINKLEDRKSVV